MWKHLIMLYGSMAIWRATTRKIVIMILFVTFRSVVRMVDKARESLGQRD